MDLFILLLTDIVNADRYTQNSEPNQNRAIQGAIEVWKNKVQETFTDLRAQLRVGPHVSPAMPMSSLSLRQERAFNKSLCAGECGAEFHGGRELGTLSTFRELIESTDTKRKNSRRISDAFVNQKVFLVANDRQFYSTASKGHRNWIYSWVFIRNCWLDFPQWRWML
jgi:hypothetical protein